MLTAIILSVLLAAWLYSIHRRVSALEAKPVTKWLVIQVTDGLGAPEERVVAEFPTEGEAVKFRDAQMTDDLGLVSYRVEGR